MDIATPLGPMIAVGDDKVLYLLEFVDQCGLPKRLKLLEQISKTEISSGKTAPLHSIEEELHQYFEKKLQTFQTPLHLFGTPFQMQVWKELQKIPFGKTRSYAELALSVGRPTAFRAVAQANRRNRLAIIVPCHRVIYTGGGLGGYAGGLDRKKGLLAHEKDLLRLVHAEASASSLCP